MLWATLSAVRSASASVDGGQEATEADDENAEEESADEEAEEESSETDPEPSGESEPAAEDVAGEEAPAGNVMETADDSEVPATPALGTVEVQPYEPHPVAPPKPRPTPAFNPIREASIRRSYDLAQAAASTIAKTPESWKAFAERRQVELAAEGAAPEEPTSGPATKVALASEAAIVAEQDVLSLRKATVAPRRPRRREEESGFSWVWTLAALAGVLLVPIGVLLARPTRNS